jgi:hypothetical protein
MTYLLLAREADGWPRSDERLFRIVSEPLASKGRQRYMGCGPEGRVGLSLQDKHVTEANCAFNGLVRGDIIAIEGTETRGDGLALGSESRVRLRARTGQRLGLER